MDIFYTLFYVPTFNLLMFLSNLFAGNIGWAILAIALISKLLTVSLTRGQIESAKKNKELQTQIKKIKEKYRYNQEQMVKEQANLQMKALPGQLKGCLSLIIFFVLFVQIRSTVLDLVNKGYHAYNQVAYAESQKKKEDAVKYKVTTDLPLGKNTLEICVKSSDGKELTKTYQFEVVENKEQRLKQIETEELAKSAEIRKGESDKLNEALLKERASDIGVYQPLLEKNLSSIVLGRFLIFPTETKQVYLITEKQMEFDFFLRPPSKNTIVSTSIVLKLNGIDVTADSEISAGEALNLEFFGMNLSRVATDYNILDLAITLPYIILAVISAVTQYLVTKLYTASPAATSDKKPEKKSEQDKNKKDKRKEKNAKEEPDMSEMMADVSKMTSVYLPIFTALISLGYFGGANFIPTGVTLFWTGQNTFVIIQQMLSNRKQITKNLGEKWQKISTKFSKQDNLAH